MIESLQICVTFVYSRHHMRMMGTVAQAALHEARHQFSLSREPVDDTHSMRGTPET